MYSILFIISVLWLTSSSLPISDNGVSPEFKQEEENTLSQLDGEAMKQEFTNVWERSKSLYTKLNSKNLEEVYRNQGILNEGEIRILICYCHGKVGQTTFYADLNEDLRNNTGGYPITTKVLKEAITKLMKHQSGLPGILYRSEPVDPLFEEYQNLLKSSKSSALTQFTSTSTQYDTAKLFRDNSREESMIIQFEDSQLGASVVDFSLYNESEVLLPLGGVYTVKTATKDENGNYFVVLTDPSSGNINNSNVFIIFVSVLIIKLV